MSQFYIVLKVCNFTAPVMIMPEIETRLHGDDVARYKGNVFVHCGTVVNIHALE